MVVSQDKSLNEKTIFDAKNSLTQSVKTDRESDLSLVGLDVELSSQEQIEGVLSSSDLEKVFTDYHEIDLLVGSSIQGVRELRDILTKIYTDYYIKKSTDTTAPKFGLHFFQNKSLFLGYSLVSGEEHFSNLIQNLSAYSGLDEKRYGGSPSIFENILGAMDDAYFSSSPKVKKLLTVYIARGFEDGIDLNLLSQVMERSKNKNINILFVEVNGFVNPDGRMFTLQELYEYIYKDTENREKLKEKMMPEGLGKPIQFKSNTNPKPLNKEQNSTPESPKQKPQKQKEKSAPKEAPEDIDKEKKPASNIYVT